MARRGFSITVKGQKELVRKLQRLAKRIGPEAIAPAMFEEAEKIMTRSKLEFVPVDTGNLRNSGHVVPEVTKRDVTMTLGFGGPAGIGNTGRSNDDEVGYAIVVHEDQEALHKTGEAKYLETPFMQAIPGMAQRIAAKARRRLEGL